MTLLPLRPGAAAAWTLAILLAASPVAAQYHVGAMPQRVGSVQEGRVVLSSTFMVTRYSTKEVEVPDGNGKTVKKQIQETAQVPDTLMWTYSADELNAHTADRQPIDPDDLLRRLQEEAVVFVSDHGLRADATFVSLLKPETICLFLPAARPGGQPPAEAAAEPAPPQLRLPASPQPAAGLASFTADGKCLVRERTMTVFENTAYRTIQTPQGERKVPYSIKITSQTENTTELPASEVKGFDMAGQPIAAADLAAALAAETPVLVSRDGQPVDPAFLKIIKPGTLIIALPQPRAPEPAAAPAEGGAPAPQA